MPDLVRSQHLHQAFMPAFTSLILHDRMARRRFCGLHGLTGLESVPQRSSVAAACFSRAAMAITFFKSICSSLSSFDRTRCCSSTEASLHVQILPLLQARYEQQELRCHDTHYRGHIALVAP